MGQDYFKEGQMEEEGTRGSNDYSVIVEGGLCENTLRGKKAQERGQRSL